MGRQIPEQHVERTYLKDLKELIDYGAETYGEKTAFRYRVRENSSRAKTETASGCSQDEYR